MHSTDSTDIFIQQHQTAHSHGMTLSQFADFLGIQPASVVRRRNRIKQVVGISLPQLPIENGGKDVRFPTGWTPATSEDKSVMYEYPKHLRPKRFVITSAQNATRVNSKFLKSIKQYCETMEAELMVLPYRYHNPTSIWTKTDEQQDWWDKAIVPYICNDYMKIGDKIRVMGHVPIQPTASNPLSGFDAFTGSDSGIVGHPKVQLLTVPTPSRSLPKILTTTGTITVPNYTPSKAGQKAHHHHSYAAVVVEFDGDLFHLRHIHASDDGSFYDLDKRFSGNVVSLGCAIAGLVTGDTHAEFIDDNVRDATYTNPDSMINVLKPPVVVLHDIEDFYRRNHHHKGNHLLSYAKHHYGRDNVEEGLQVTADFLDQCIPSHIRKVIVKSNHDEALDRWLRESDPKLDPENARFYYYMMYNLTKTVAVTDSGFRWDDPFEFWCHHPDQQRGISDPSSVTILHRDQSYQICGIELGFHGDKGPNGSRGSMRSMSKIGPKCVIGHSHSPGIYEGVYQVGVSARLNLEYVSGPSSWMNTHVIIYPDGKRTLVHIIEGKWRI